MDCSSSSLNTPFLTSSNYEVVALEKGAGPVTGVDTTTKMKENVVVVMTGGGGNVFQETILNNNELFNPGQLINSVINP